MKLSIAKMLLPKNRSHPTRVRGLKLFDNLKKLEHFFVAPHAGAWIETFELPFGVVVRDEVAPHAGAWIETTLITIARHGAYVAPHAGAWIETCVDLLQSSYSGVAPHAGAWIET